MLARLALAACALALGGWLAVSLHGARLLDGAVASAQRIPLTSPPERFRPVDDELRRAARLTPDTRPRILRAKVALAARSPGRAVQLLERVLREEPDNIEAWATLLQASLLRHDAGRAAAARRRIRQLSPLSR